jgi:hypothetical protein
MYEWSHGQPENDSWVSLNFAELREKPDGAARRCSYAQRP